MPVRKIPKNHVSVTGRHATRKSVHQADFESPLENDYLTLLDFDRRVKSYEVQPVRVPVPGIPRGYVPDVLVHFHPAADGSPVTSELTEVKSEDDLHKNSAKYAAKFAAAERYAGERGWVFIRKTNRDIRTPRLSNLKFLRTYRWIEPAETDVATLLHALHMQGGQSTLMRLIDAVCDHPDERLRLLPILWHLVVNGRIDVDMDVAFGADISLWLPGYAA